MNEKRLSFVTGIPVPPYCHPSAVAASPQYSSASPIYSDYSAPPSPSVSLPSAARVVATNGAGPSTAPAPDKVELEDRWLAEEQSAAVAVEAAGVAGSPTAVRHSDPVERLNRQLAEGESAAAAADGADTRDAVMAMLAVIASGGAAAAPAQAPAPAPATAPAPDSNESGVKRRRALGVALAEYRRRYG